MTNKHQTGFHLIEFVILIAIIAIIGLVGVPKAKVIIFDTQTAATTAVASALSASNISNYLLRKANSTLGVPVVNCTDIATTMKSGLPAGYTITSADVAIDASTSCTLTGPYSTTATFTATGIS